MSYILEALKKSEQERGHGDSPTVQTIHSSSLQYQTQKKTLWPYLLIIAILINALVLLYIFRSDEEKTTVPQVATVKPELVQDSPVDRVLPEPAKTTQAASSVEPKPAVKPVEQAAITTPPNTETATPVQTRSTHPITEKTILDIYELPADIQAAVPELQFSAHVYSSNPHQRSVVINGNFMEQGDRLTRQLTLDEITPDGVILEYDGIYIRSSILSQWDVN